MSNIGMLNNKYPHFKENCIENDLAMRAIEDLKFPKTIGEWHASVRKGIDLAKEHYCSQHIFILQSVISGFNHGVYVDKQDLKIAVDKEIKQHPYISLSYVEFKPNTEEPYGWDWAYIHPDEERENLTKGGGMVPDKRVWGLNLIEFELIDKDALHEAYET